MSVGTVGARGGVELAHQRRVSPTPDVHDALLEPLGLLAAVQDEHDLVGREFADALVRACNGS
jgi:hypothetical protein